MTSAQTFILYFAFAGVAIGLNVLVQNLIFAFFEGPSTIFIAMLAGAGSALVAKYFLDRQFVFCVSKNAEASEFARYAITGGLITAVFFAVEYTIWIAFQTAQARDVGIVVGMTLGYALKYALDRRYTFKARERS